MALHDLRMTRLAVFGPGLLGGSILLAARASGRFEVAAWGRREDAVAELRARGMADRASTDARAVAEGAEIIVFCVPIGAMPELAQRIVPVVSPHTLVTDVGSVKGCVVETLGPIFEGRARFIGSHPMAGSEQTGLAAARADLFEGSVCIVTPEPGCDPEDQAAARAFWETLGCRVRELAPREHDDIVARVSHFPHLLAAALVQAVAQTGAGALDFAGPGFRDTTRVAAGPPEMWTEILRTNRRAVQKSAEAMIEKLREVITLLDRDAPGDDLRMNEFLSQAKALRDTLRTQAEGKQ